MDMDETPLQMAKRHIAEQQALIENQRELIRRMEYAGQPTGIAQDMIRTMERTLQLYQQDLDRLSG